MRAVRYGVEARNTTKQAENDGDLQSGANFLGTLFLTVEASFVIKYRKSVQRKRLIPGRQFISAKQT